MSRVRVTINLAIESGRRRGNKTWAVRAVHFRLTLVASSAKLTGVTTLRRACRPHAGGRPYGHHRWP